MMGFAFTVTQSLSGPGMNEGREAGKRRNGEGGGGYLCGGGRGRGARRAERVNT